MAKLTNLELVQNILSSMDSDNVNSISDTEEAQQVQTVLKEVYNNIISRRRWEFLKKTRQLENVSDVTRPNKMKIPDNVTRVECFQWQTRDVVDVDHKPWKELRYLAPCDFIRHVQSRDVEQLKIQDRVLEVVNDDLVSIPMITDQEPQYWTSFDDVHIYMDNFIHDNPLTTAIAERTSVDVTQQQLWRDGDTEIQFLPPEMFPLLLAEAKSTCWLNFKGASNAKAEQVASRQYIKMREEEPTVQPQRQWYNYGKPPSGTGAYRTDRGLSSKFRS